MTTTFEIFDPDTGTTEGPFGLTEMLNSNGDDAEFCAWAKSATAGDHWNFGGGAAAAGVITCCAAAIKDPDLMTVERLISILKQVDNPRARIAVLSSDGIEELPFCAPVITRFNRGTDAEFIAINVLVED